MGGATPAAAQTRFVQPTASTTAVKKPIIVGAKWTALRGSSQPNNPPAASPAIFNFPATATPSTNMPTSVIMPSMSCAIKADRKEGLSHLLRYRQPETTIQSTGKRKLAGENDLLGSQLSLLKEICSGNADGGSEAEIKEQNQVQSYSRRNTEEQPRKRAKIVMESLPSTSAGLLRETSPPLSLISRVYSTSADGVDLAGTLMYFAIFWRLIDVRMQVGAPKSKSQRKRERQKMSRQRKAELERVARLVREETAKMRLGQEEREKRKREEAKAELEKELEKEISELAQEKAEATSPETSSSAPLRVVHPLPPKPQIAFTGSSYRPGRQHDRRRSISSSWSEGSSRRSRSRSRGRETIQASKVRSLSRSRSESKKRNSSMDRQQGNRTKSSGFASNASEGHTPLPGMTAVPQAVIGNGNATWPTTSPRRQFELFSEEGNRISIQHLTFSSSGRNLAVVCKCLIALPCDTCNLRHG